MALYRGGEGVRSRAKPPPNVALRATISAAADEHRGKRSKAEAGYENPARNPLRHCGPSGRPGICAHYRRPRSCTEVAGDIAPTAWCWYWKQRTGEDDVGRGERKEQLRESGYG